MKRMDAWFTLGCLALSFAVCVEVAVHCPIFSPALKTNSFSNLVGDFDLKSFPKIKTNMPTNFKLNDDSITDAPKFTSQSGFSGIFVDANGKQWLTNSAGRKFELRVDQPQIGMEYRLDVAGVTVLTVERVATASSNTLVVTISSNAVNRVIVNDQRKKWPNLRGFYGGTKYFEDLDVFETVTRRRLTIYEVMDMIDRQPNVKHVELAGDRKRLFKLDTLAYPQYAHDYELTKSEWMELQEYCTEKLNEPIAVDEVLAHWRSVANGTPPFGLRVQP